MLWLGYWIFYQDKATEKTNRIFYWILFVVSFFISVFLYYISLCMCEPPLNIESLINLLLFSILPVITLTLAVNNFMLEIKTKYLLGKIIRIILIIVMSYFIIKIISVAVYSYRFEI